MIMRPPATPLITSDPYFSVWSFDDLLYGSDTMHWTGSPNTMLGYISVDGKDYRFMGAGDGDVIPQVYRDMNALTTIYAFENDIVRLVVYFTTPLLPDRLDLVSRPVSYIKADWEVLDGGEHTIYVKLSISEEFCLDKRGQMPVETEMLDFDGIICAKMGAAEQKPLNRSGDNLRIDWGYVYLAVKGEDAAAYIEEKTSDEGMTFITAAAGEDSLFMVAYDDIYSIRYFGDNLKAYWHKYWDGIGCAIKAAADEYEDLCTICTIFSKLMFCDAVRAGGEKYAEICELAYRQAFAAHKLVTDTEDNILFISKECFSNGCAATVDVSYPSIPLFLIYCPELVKGMMRPIFKYARSEAWPFDFAPHDAGQYPLVEGQVYGENELKMQMPVEECGNMLIIAANAALAEGDPSFAAENLDLLSTWADYLLSNGYDPENQLCTDDFAGHLAHNCNLSIKAAMGIAGYGIILDMLGDYEGACKFIDAARLHAEKWVKDAANGDGTFRLAFDRPDTWSMKYNAVWDKLWGTDIFPKEAIASEIASYFAKTNPYGLPLDCRQTYTKSDWLVWCAAMYRDRADFEKAISPLWTAYDRTLSRVPMTDWYFTVTGEVRGFRHRSVVGGVFIKMLEASSRLAGPSIAIAIEE